MQGGPVEEGIGQIYQPASIDDPLCAEGRCRRRNSLNRSTIVARVGNISNFTSGMTAV